jgi:2-polyprenyl-3-methyl-5-hydroxy-6-metoxy-1,4-benzoquinol methylase
MKIKKKLQSKDYYHNIYDKDYFLGKKSFFYKFGYKNFVNIWKSRLNILLQYKNQGKLLDVGCALGYMLILFSKYFKVYGIDCSRYAINIAKKNIKKGIFKVHNAEESLPFQNHTFDVVTCMDVLEHLKNTDKLLKNIFNVLKDEGILFLTTPNYNILRKLIYHFPDKMEHHISLFHINEILKKLERNGFKILNYSTGINFLDKTYWFKNRLGPETFVISKKI